MSELSILNQLVAAGMTPIGACAMAGNMRAESALQANNAQDGMTRLSDEEYTAAATAGTIDFANDGIGYGLCQWTYPTRKAALLEYCRQRGKSVGDETAQIEFCLAELQNDYPVLWEYLRGTQNLSEAAGRICREYERPAINNSSTRTQYADALYRRYGEAIMHNVQCTMHKEETSPGYMPTIEKYSVSPEARYLADKLEELGYNVLWDGLYSCLVNFQQRMGLRVDGVCGEQTWGRLMKNAQCTMHNAQ